MFGFEHKLGLSVLPHPIKDIVWATYRYESTYHNLFQAKQEQARQAMNTSPQQPTFKIGTQVLFFTRNINKPNVSRKMKSTWFVRLCQGRSALR